MFQDLTFRVDLYDLGPLALTKSKKIYFNMAAIIIHILYRRKQAQRV